MGADRPGTDQPSVRDGPQAGRIGGRRVRSPAARWAK